MPESQERSPRQTTELWTIKRMLDWCVEYLSRAQDEHPRLSAERLICHATKLERIEIYTNYDRPFDQAELVVMREAVKRRAQGEPLQYIEGATAFRSLTLLCKAPILIPRPETEYLVELVNQEIEALVARQPNRDLSKMPLRILDVGTGTGCIALSLLDEHADKLSVLALDLDEAAVSLANKNAEQCESKLVSQEVIFTKPGQLCILCSDLFAAVSPDYLGSIDLIISNPPYIPSDLMPDLPAEVKDYESHRALDGGAGGLVIASRLIKDAALWLTSGGVLALELHELNASQVGRECVELNAYKNSSLSCDLTGRERFVIAHL